MSPLLTPVIMVEVSNIDGIFAPSDTVISTQLDNTKVAHCDDLCQATIAVLALYWVFDIAFPNELKKTLPFLAGHVCGLVPYKPTAASQKVLNRLYM